MNFLGVIFLNLALNQVLGWLLSSHVTALIRVLTFLRERKECCKCVYVCVDRKATCILTVMEIQLWFWNYYLSTIMTSVFNSSVATVDRKLSSALVFSSSCQHSFKTRQWIIIFSLNKVLEDTEVNVLLKQRAWVIKWYNLNSVIYEAQSDGSWIMPYHLQK